MIDISFDSGCFPAYGPRHWDMLQNPCDPHRTIGFENKWMIQTHLSQDRSFSKRKFLMKTEIVLMKHSVSVFCLCMAVSLVRALYQSLKSSNELR